MLIKFNYALTDIKQLENELNFYDSQVFRDNPIGGAEDVVVDVSETTSGDLFIIGKSELIECEDTIKKYQEFQIT